MLYITKPPASPLAIQIDWTPCLQSSDAIASLEIIFPSDDIVDLDLGDAFPFPKSTNTAIAGGLAGRIYVLRFILAAVSGLVFEQAVTLTIAA